MRTTFRGALLACVLSCGCGGAAAEGAGAPPVTGDPDGPPAMATLPSARQARDEFTDRMQFAWTLTAESFEVEPPPQPASRETADVQAWADGPLREWLERRQHAVDSARRELDAAAEEAHPQRIMAGALVGLMYEDIARILRRLPVPAELDREPEITRVYMSVLESNASPYLEHARRAYRACAANASEPTYMRHWSSYCAGRADNLPMPAGQREQTTVSVSTE